IKANDSGKRPVFSHVGGAQLGSGAEWRWSRTGDFYGNSNYPAWHSFEPWDDAYVKREEWHTTALYEVWNSLMLRTDYSRAANGRDRAFWGAEFQGGPVSTHLHMGRTPSADDIQRWMLAGLASGMNGISFWNHRAEWFWGECNGFGLLDPLGNTTERIEEAGRIGRAINRHADLFALGQPPPSRVALLVTDDLYHFAQGTRDQALRLLTYNLRGHYARLWRLGIPVDFVEASEIAGGALSDYDAAILPMPLSLGDDYFAHLRDFVARGGLLISEACPGRFDAYGFCPRSQMVGGAEEVFGARHSSVQLVEEPGEPRWSPEARGYGEFCPATVFDGVGPLEGEQLQANFYVQTLELTSGAPILTAGEDVVGVANQYGEGTAILLGTFAGLCATAHTHLESDATIARLLRDYAGIGPDHDGTLLRRRREHGDKQAWFFINPLDVEVTETIDLEQFTSAEDLLSREVLDTLSGTSAITVAPISIRCLVLS
ncbi:MAG: beta-galactosidase trimerization domain-containing protein, partial [Chloroflexota bacterium]|nr:beta-galactosidase trimerization domain-containing protein [Chloroflexota bacterium]